MDFNIYIFIILILMLLFLIINDIFKLINIINLFDGLLYLYIIIVSIIFIDTETITLYIITLGIGLIIYLGLSFYNYFSKKYVYLLLKYCKKDYNIIKKALEKQTKAEFKFNYYKKFPFLIIVKNPDKTIYKNLKLTIKHAREKKFTIYNYWQLIVLLIIITIIVRF